MYYSSLLSSLSIVAVLGGCAQISQDATRSGTDPLGFQYAGDVARIEDQAMLLNRSGDQLVRRSALLGTVGPDDANGLLSANDLESSIQTMGAQMSALEQALADQSAALADLHLRRGAGDVSRRDYTRSVAAIEESRARVAAALTLTVAQAERAQVNLLAASRQGQTGLDRYVAATTALASNAQTTRTAITPVSATKRTPLTLVTPRSGVLR